MATLFAIQDRARPHTVAVADPEHFTLSEGQPASATLLIDEPGWTPYCLDDANRRVLFVQIPPDVDLSQAAFVYTPQFELAQRALAVSYADLTQLADTLAAPETLIFIFSTGRCGSTLMSRILNYVDGVYSLSEPDIFTNLTLARQADPRRDEELTQVIKACTLLLCPRDGSNAPNVVALKFRAHAISVADLMRDAFPNARLIFMYRNAVSWARSMARFLQRLGLLSELPREMVLYLWPQLTGAASAYVEAYLDTRADTLYSSELLAPAWTSYLDRYMVNYERDVPFYTIRYEDLNDQREATLSAALAFCGLPASALQQAMQGFEADSQAGTAIARDVQADGLTPAQIERFLELLSRHPRFNQPDFRLPDRRSH